MVSAGPRSLKPPEENLFLALLLASGAAGGPWCSLASRCTIPLCLSSQDILPVFLHIFSPPQESLSVSFSSHKETNRVSTLMTSAELDYVCKDPISK